MASRRRPCSTDGKSTEARTQPGAAPRAIHMRKETPHCTFRIESQASMFLDTAIQRHVTCERKAKGWNVEEWHPLRHTRFEAMSR
jgi:hypothetical protein